VTRDDPPFFAETCGLMFTINIGGHVYPADVRELDAFIDSWLDGRRAALAGMAPGPEADREGHSLAVEVERLAGARAQAVAAFLRNDMDGVSKWLDSLALRVYALRAAPLAGAEARNKLFRTQRARKAASAPRPGLRQSLVEKVAEAMRQGRNRGESFKEFLRAWENAPIDGLRLTQVEPCAYQITDENAIDGEPDSKGYKISTLAPLYSKAGKRR